MDNKEGSMINITMDVKASLLVANYIREHLDKSDPETYFEVYVVWKCKTLQNCKFLISSTLSDGMYYEVTYNGDKYEWYLDAYKKFENKCISGDSVDDICRNTIHSHDN